MGSINSVCAFCDMLAVIRERLHQYVAEHGSPPDAIEITRAEAEVLAPVTRLTAVYGIPVRIT